MSKKDGILVTFPLLPFSKRSGGVMVTRLPTVNIPIPGDWVCKEALSTMPDCELFPPSSQGAYMRPDLR